MFKLQTAVVVMLLSASVQSDAAHPTRELSAAQAKAEGLIVRRSHDFYVDDMRVSLSVPLEKHGTLESMSFSYAEDGKTLIRSEFPFHEIVKGRANGVYRREAVTSQQNKAERDLQSRCRRNDLLP